ncbi:S-layer homology domain-containing protein, partial [Peptoniphilus lacrimalis]|uniref:S-layer homology domain-containing protein n=1 Tax=Peptoniphilus lacrimalis TaxID=33031 RepID=UPI0032BFEE55
YNTVAWSPAQNTVITGDQTFNASATKNDTSADKITKAGGLAPKATAAFVGDTLNWAGSAVLSDTAKQAANATELQGLLDKATITDATDPARTSAAAGEFTGKVKVTFEDKSFIEVDKQILYVYENGAKKPGSDKPVPTDAATVTFTKDDKSIKDWGTVEPIIVKKNKAVPSDKFPNAQAKDGYNTVAWSPAQNTVITGDQTFNASATSNTPTKNSEDYDPHYTGKSGKPGETVRIDAPTFTKKGVNGNVPAPTTPTKGTTFVNNDPTQNNVTVDPNTGAITVAIPQDAPVGSIITIEVKVTYPDTSYDTVKVSVTVTDNTQPKPEDDKSKTPIVDPVNDGDTSISGKGEPGSDIIINVPGKDPIKTTVDDGGKWIAPIDPAHEGDVIEVIQIEVGKKPSDPAYVTVGGRSIIVPGHDDGGHWWFGGGSFKPVETEEQVIDKTEHGIHIAYIFGYKDHTFRCEGKITRAEAASMIAHIAKLDLSDNSKPDFKDTPSSWYNAAINAMVKKNLMFADKNGNFRPNEPITRGEFARAIQFIDKENKKEAPFMDIKGHEFEEAINQAYSNGRIAGYPDGTFKPDESITRAEAVTILNNFDGRMVRERGIEDVKKDLIKFTDLIPSHWAYYEIIEASNSHAYSRISNDSKEEKWSNLIK